MSIVTDRIYEDASGVAACAKCPDDAAGSYLVEALGTTLDSIDVGVIIVNGEARILHANQAAKSMLEPAVADRLARRVPRYTACRSDQRVGNSDCNRPNRECVPGVGSVPTFEAVEATENLKGEKMLDKMSARCQALSVV